MGSNPMVNWMALQLWPIFGIRSERLNYLSMCIVAQSLLGLRNPPEKSHMSNHLTGLCNACPQQEMLCLGPKPPGCSKLVRHASNIVSWAELQ